MATRDLVHRISVIPSVLAGAADAAVTANTTGPNSVRDTLGYESVTFLLRVHTWTAGAIRLYFQDSADGTTWAAVDTTHPPTNSNLTRVGVEMGPANIIGGVTPAALGAAGTILIGLTGAHRRWVRAVINKAAYSGISSADIILSHARHSGAAV